MRQTPIWAITRFFRMHTAATGDNLWPFICVSHQEIESFTVGQILGHDDRRMLKKFDA